ncbi:MAG: 4Fe-4S binding protein, partial [Planctomycetes bacterium]|nr:4Fe-4S binding protein [Planctomycetota bacterium]
MAALLAAASVALPPAPLLQMESAGRCVVYGEGQAALDMAMQLAGRLDVTLLVNGDTGDLLLPPRRPFAALAGRIARAQGHLGAFEIALKDTRSIAPWSRSGIAFEAGVGELTCDLVLDMSGETPLFTAFEKRDGYLHVDPADPVALQRAAFAAVDLVGTFEKPRYVALRADLCAHSRSGRTGCTRCLRHCPTGAITPAGDHVAIDPFVCAGCGSCAALCPTGAVTYAAPAPDATTSRLRELLAVYAAAGGRHPVVLLHET